MTTTGQTNINLVMCTVHFLHPPPHSSVISQKDMQEVYRLPSVDRVPAFGQINSEKVTLQSENKGF